MSLKGGGGVAQHLTQVPYVFGAPGQPPTLEEGGLNRH